MRTVDLTGEEIGSLKVLYKKGRKSENTIWVCECECGSIKSYCLANLIRGRKGLNNGSVKIVSCGCKRKPTAFRQTFYNYRKSANKRHLSFELSLEEFRQITQENCHYCGIGPSNKARLIGGGFYTYNGIDRVDSSKGYIADNIVPCCSTCNRGKLALKREDFLDWINRVYHHSVIRKNVNKIEIQELILN